MSKSAESEAKKAGTRSKDWRDGFNTGEGQTLIEQIAFDMHRRNSKGRSKYGPDFQGDPLVQAYEEALDLSWYLKVAAGALRRSERQIEALETELTGLRQENLKLRSQMVYEDSRDARRHKG